MSFDFESYSRCIPHEADNVPAWRTQAPILSAMHEEKEMFIYPACFEVGSQKGDLFLVTDEAGTVLYHSEANSPKDAVTDAIGAHQRQSDTLRHYKAMRKNVFENHLKEIENLTFDGHDFIHRAGLCKLGYLGFCHRFGFLPREVTIHEVNAVRKEESRILLVLYWIVHEHALQAA